MRYFDLTEQIETIPNVSTAAQGMGARASAEGLRIRHSEPSQNYQCPMASRTVQARCRAYDLPALLYSAHRAHYIASRTMYGIAFPFFR